MSSRSRRARGLAATLALTLASCSTTATIQRFDGPDNEAEIVRSDAHTLYVRSSNGQIYKLDRNAVGSIDHPGNVSMIVGAAIGVMAASVVLSLPDKDRDQAGAALGLIYGVPAAALLFSGGYYYLRSKDAAGNFENASTTVMPAPPTPQADPWQAPPPGHAPLPPPPPLPPPLPSAPAPPGDGGVHD